MADTIVKQITFVTIYCYKCHTPFALPSDTKQRLHDTGNSFWCPICGAGQHYTVSTVDKLKSELAKAKSDTEYYRRRQVEARADAELERRSKIAYKGQVTRLKNRAANGICPCCNRYFANLHRHMANQHPEFLSEDGK